MSRLIEALTVFLKYRNESRPTHCEHDVLRIMSITYDEVRAEDRKRLNELGFIWSESDGEGAWISFRYGSA